MKILVLLFAALLVAGCGEKSSSEGSESASENPTPSNESAEPSGDTAKPPPAESLSEEPSDTPNSLSDADVKRLLKEAVDRELVKARVAIPGARVYLANESEPFSGWLKGMYDSGQVSVLGQIKGGRNDGLWTLWYEDGQKESEKNFKDGKEDGLQTQWLPSGQKMTEETYKDGKPDGLQTMWHENGQKRHEATYKDGEEVSAKYWNSKGEEVETWEESEK